MPITAADVHLSLATIALDEAELIGGMLDSVAGLADDVVIGIDNRTSDQTEAILKERGAQVFGFEWQDDFSAARNLSLERARGDWILVIDPDERLTEQGRDIVRDVLQRALPDIDGFSFMAQQCDMQGNVHALVKTSVRLFRRDGVRYRGVVHEEPWVDGRPGRWLHVQGVPVIAHCGYAPERWVGRRKHELYLRLLEKRVALDPTDEYARFKLGQEQRMDVSGMVLA